MAGNPMPYDGTSDLLRRCKLMLDEIDLFQSYVKEQQREKAVDTAWFRNTVRRELKSIEKLSKPDPGNQNSKHSLKNSNFPFYEAVWSTAKCCMGITALGRRFYWSEVLHNPPPSGNISRTRPKVRKHRAYVDIVSRDGSEWIKVCTVTEKTMLHDLAKAGWVCDSSSDESEDVNQDLKDGDEAPEGLLKQAEILIKVSRAARIRYRHPTVRLVLPRIKKNCQKEVFDTLEKVRALGIIVQTAEDLPESPPVATVLHQLTFGDQFGSFSDIINIDCTVLLAFISDLSHIHVEPEKWHSKPLQRQIETESQDQLLPRLLWPACGAKKMVCSREAAIRMHEIVDIIGTETEKTRTMLLVMTGNSSHLTRKQRIEALQEISEKKVPLEWCLPIEVVDMDLASVKSNLPPVFEEVSKILSPINQSVFLYGWATGKTTITSNRTVAKEIEATIEAHRKDEEEKGPDIWVCPVARSLVGKEKNRW